MPVRKLIASFSVGPRPGSSLCRQCLNLGKEPPVPAPCRAYLLCLPAFSHWHPPCSPSCVAMLKITLHDHPNELRFRLEGKVAGAWVSELRQCWQTALSTPKARAFPLDRGDVVLLVR